MNPLLISACLLGVVCRYDGKTKPLPEETLNALKKHYHLIPICPEIFGGLPTPRMPSEIQKDRRVLRCDGADLTVEYQKGAREALRLAEMFDCGRALLKERSPSCGCGEIYDGTFSGIRIEGDGITSELLKKHGISIFGESEIRLLLQDGN